MLSETFKKLQNKVYTDSRDFPVLLTEEHRISGAINDENRKIKLGEKVHSLENVIVYKIFKSSVDLDIRLVEYESLAIFYSQIDLTVNYVSYDATTDVYHFEISLYRGDTLESWNHGYDITGSIGENNFINFDTIQGKFTILAGNFFTNARAVISIIGYESTVLVIDSFNPFVGTGATNHLYFNVPANAVYINELPHPQQNGDIYVLVKYLGLGSVITAEAMNDIVNIVKYYNLLPKFEIIKNNNQDVQLIIRGEYYYLDTYVEKFDDATMQIEDEVLLGMWNALIGFLDIPNHIFNVRRVSVGSTYNELIADLTNFTNENPEYELPIFIVVFDTNKSVFEYAYINRGAYSSNGGAAAVHSYNIAFSNAINISFNLISDKKPVVMVWDANNMMIIPDEIEAEGTSVEITFVEAQTGTIAAVN